jgi:3-dehydroquinate synthase
MKSKFKFSFGNFTSRVWIEEELPDFHEFADPPSLIVCDSNTEYLAGKITTGRKLPVLFIESGEKAKTWDSVQKILKVAHEARLGRDALFIGIGGGIISDLTAFAASIYMRGALLCLVSTTLLGMVDAGLGGKTGINLFGLKNLAGTFYPAGFIVMPLEALETLPEREWKSGMAELIKTAILDSDEFFILVKSLMDLEKDGRKNPVYRDCLKECISRAIAYKAGNAEKDPRETSGERALLNLGHTFGHALESATEPGELSHGEAVAWGIVRACELGQVLGITPAERAQEIKEILSIYSYETSAPHPLVKSRETLWDAMLGDKKQIAGKLRFIVPGAKSAQMVSSDDSPALEGKKGEELIRKIMNGEYNF